MPRVTVTEIAREQDAGFPETGPVARRRDHLVAAAAAVFAERGFRGATLRQIGSAAGLLAGSVYHHFASKDALFEAVQCEGYARMQRRVEAAVAEVSDPWERLEAACHAHLSEMLGGDAVARVTGLGLVGRRDGPVSPAVKAARDAYEALLAGLIAGLPLRKQIDRSLLRLQLLGALNWTLVWYRPDGKSSPRQIARHLVGLLR